MTWLVAVQVSSRWEPWLQSSHHCPEHAVVALPQGQHGKVRLQQISGEQEEAAAVEAARVAADDPGPDRGEVDRLLGQGDMPMAFCVALWNFPVNTRVWC